MLLPSVGYYPRAGSIAQSAPPLESRSSAASPGPTCTGRGPPHHLLMEAGRAESNDRYPHTMQTNYHPPHHIRDIIISDHIMIITRRSIKNPPTRNNETVNLFNWLGTPWCCGDTDGGCPDPWLGDALSTVWLGGPPRIRCTHAGICNAGRSSVPRYNGDRSLCPRPSAWAAVPPGSGPGSA